MIIGLTGGMACGKSTCSNMIKKMGIQVFDADAEAHKLLERDVRVIRDIQDQLPQAVDTIDSKEFISRDKLSKLMLNDDSVIEIVTEAITIPLKYALLRFIERNRDNRFAVVDAPMLFEYKWDTYCEKIITVDAPRDRQELRIMKRHGMTELKMMILLDLQMTSEERNLKSDYVIDNGSSLYNTNEQIVNIFLTLQQI